MTPEGRRALLQRADVYAQEFGCIHLAHVDVTEAYLAGEADGFKRGLISAEREVLRLGEAYVSDMEGANEPEFSQYGYAAGVCRQAVRWIRALAEVKGKV